MASRATKEAASDDPSWSVMLDATAYYRLGVHVAAGEAASQSEAIRLASRSVKQPQFGLGAGGKWSVHSFDAGSHRGATATPSASGGFDVTLVARVIASRSARVTARDEEIAIDAAYEVAGDHPPAWPGATDEWTFESDGGIVASEPEECDAAPPGPR